MFLVGNVLVSNKKINLTGTGMCESERTELRRRFLQLQTYRAPQVPVGYFCRYVVYWKWLFKLRTANE